MGDFCEYGAPPVPQALGSPDANSGYVWDTAPVLVDLPLIKASRGPVPAISIEVEPPCVCRGLLLQQTHGGLRIQLHILRRHPSLIKRDARTYASKHSGRQDRALQLTHDPPSHEPATDTNSTFAAMAASHVQGRVKEALYIGFTQAQRSRPL